ncbi:MAG: glycosyltransferase family 1 protein, partial [Thalassospira sp.]
GPADIVRGTKAGAIDADLREAALAALELTSEDARALAEQYSWQNSATQFLHNLAPFSGGFDGIEAVRISVDDATRHNAGTNPATSPDQDQESLGTAPVGQPAQ